MRELSKRIDAAMIAQRAEERSIDVGDVLLQEIHAAIEERSERHVEHARDIFSNDT